MKIKILIYGLVLTLIGCGGGGSSLEQQAKEELQLEVELSNDCQETSECVIVMPGCPLGCGVAVNVNFEDRIINKADELINTINSTGAACAYTCLQATEKCTENKCEAVFE